MKNSKAEHLFAKQSGMTMAQAPVNSRRSFWLSLVPCGSPGLVRHTGVILFGFIGALLNRLAKGGPKLGPYFGSGDV